MGEMCAFCDVDARPLPSGKGLTCVWWHYCQNETEVVRERDSSRLPPAPVAQCLADLRDGSSRVAA